MTVVEWREPALLWHGDLSQVSRPKILEFRQDDFIPFFLEGMASDDPGGFVRAHILPSGSVRRLSTLAWTLLSGDSFACLSSNWPAG